MSATLPISETGIFPDLTYSQYNAIRDGKFPALSQSLANVLLKQSPEHAHAKFTGWSEDERTKSMSGGTILHKLILGRGQEITRIEADSFRTKAAQEARDAAYAAGETPVLDHEYVGYEAAAKCIRGKLLDRGLDLSAVVHGASNEVAIVWRSNGVLCKGMLDRLEINDALKHVDIWDLKSIVSADADKCAKHCIEYGYDVQRAAYIEGVETLLPSMAGRVRYSWVFIESEPPYAVVIRRARGSLRERGERRWRRAVNTWAQCIARDEWSGYSDSDIDCPPWALEDE
jgi:hypothetical protein